LFGADLRRERNRLGLTQEKLAEKVELHPRTLQKIEAGQVDILLTTVIRIQKAVGCSWEKLMKSN
jgi:transcriptional regulator with XRE-family HTH domain